jgi:hypothetical protein
LLRPILHLFSKEYEGGKYRKFLTGRALAKENKGKLKKVIEETIDYYKEINPEGF